MSFYTLLLGVEKRILKSLLEFASFSFLLLFLLLLRLLMSEIDDGPPLVGWSTAKRDAPRRIYP